MNPPANEPRGMARGVGRLGKLFAALFVLMGLGFVALGIWQVQRLAWKTDLIARVTSRVDAPAVAAPAPAAWPTITAASHEYLRVRLQGRWVGSGDAAHLWVRTGTELGWGYWLMSPLQTDEGFTVLVNRGYVPADQRTAVSAQLAQLAQLARPGDAGSNAVTVTGLLRISETPNWLRKNEEGRWASRNVPAMAQGLGLDAAKVAPYFVDASSTPASAGAPPLQAATLATPEWPRAGLTTLQFSNNHLSYALTWFALAALSAFGSYLLLRGKT
jgi:surfeit locus 1 family protein